MSSEPPPSKPPPSPRPLEKVPQAPTAVDLAKVAAVGQMFVNVLQELASQYQTNQNRARELRHLEKQRELEYEEKVAELDVKRAEVEAKALDQKRVRELPYIERAQRRSLGFRVSMALLFVGSLFGLVLLGQVALAPWLIALAGTFASGIGGTAAFMLRRQMKEQNARHEQEVKALIESMEEDDEDDDDADEDDDDD